jgi:hypothetical protein
MKAWKKTKRQRRHQRNARWERMFDRMDGDFHRAVRKDRRATAYAAGQQPGRHLFIDTETGDHYGGDGPFPPGMSAVELLADDDAPPFSDPAPEPVSVSHHAYCGSCRHLVQADELFRPGMGICRKWGKERAVGDQPATGTCFERDPEVAAMHANVLPKLQAYLREFTATRNVH